MASGRVHPLPDWRSPLQGVAHLAFMTPALRERNRNRKGPPRPCVSEFPSVKALVSVVIVFATLLRWNAALGGSGKEEMQ